MTSPRNPVENARRIARLYAPHVTILGVRGECLACRVDGWVVRARYAARGGFTYATLDPITTTPEGVRLVRPATPRVVRRRPLRDAA